MTWIDILLLLAAVAGVGGACLLIARSPAFWFGLGLVIFEAVRPYVLLYVSKPLSPEALKRLQKSRRMAEEWDNFRKKPRDR